MPPFDPVTLNVKGASELVSSGLNKIRGKGSSGDDIGEEENELTLKLSDEELLRLAAVVEAKYQPYEAKIRPRQDAMHSYYLGKQGSGSPQSQEYPIAANLLFEAEETFLPAALSKNPEPVVWSDNTPEGTKVASSVKTMLQYHADTLVLRRKLSRMTRIWNVRLLGILKHGWDSKIGDITTENRDPQNFIFDPDAYIDEYGDYKGSLLGERIPTTAARLAELFPKHKAYIAVMVDGQMGTKVSYTEWRSDEYCFYTFKEKVLDKHKSEYFNYAITKKEIDEDGVEQEVTTKARNHFAVPKLPYTFLSVFSIGKHPHDETGLIEQNIPQQNKITKRETQIDKNLDRANNSIGLSGQNFNEETARQAATAMQVGNPVLIPAGGPISEAVARFPAPDLPSAMFNNLETSKSDLRTIFGVQGITATQQDEDQTARGLILNTQHDTSRIGGGIGDALEQVADNVFNWWVQLYYVFYDEEHFGAVLGRMQAVDYVEFSRENLTRKLVVSVAPNSMKPEDEVTQMNLAQALYDKGALDPKTLLTILDFPDPQNTAEQAVLWQLDKQAYMELNFPELAKKLATMQQQRMQATMSALPGMEQPAAPSAQPEAMTEPPPVEGLSAQEPSASLSQVPIGAV